MHEEVEAPNGFLVVIQNDQTQNLEREGVDYAIYDLYEGVLLVRGCLSSLPANYHEETSSRFQVQTRLLIIAPLELLCELTMQVHPIVTIYTHGGCKF